MKQFGLLIVNIVQAPAQQVKKSGSPLVTVLAFLAVVLAIVWGAQAVMPTLVASNAAFLAFLAVAKWVGLGLIGGGLLIGAPVTTYFLWRRQRAQVATVTTFWAKHTPARPRLDPGPQRRALPQTVYVTSSVGHTEEREISR